MPRTTRICKICGKEYEYCHTLRRDSGVFRYQDVACCPEHGSMYLQKIEESRAAVNKVETVANIAINDGLPDANIEELYYDFDNEDDYDEDDDWFEEEDDDDDDDSSVL